jgi:hypothetical protein
MAHDEFISKLMTETLEDSELERVPSVYPDDDFEIRRELSRLPLVSIECQLVNDSLIRFHFKGQPIDVTIDHLLSSYKKEFLQVMSSLNSKNANELSLKFARDNRPWLFFWDSSEFSGLDAKIDSILEGHQIQKAA